MAIEVAGWLRQLGLEQYISAFRDNDVDGNVLPHLTAEDLLGMGVTSIGHRRKLLAAIAAIGAEVPALVGTAASASAPVSTAEAAAVTVQAEAERRQLTVVFCDIVGSTALSTQFDPEDLRELINAYHHAVAETVTRFDGFVAKYMGDGVLIYFGYPQAHEDDAERSVRAGLAVIDAVAKLPSRVTLRVRIGIATGLAVVGDLIGAGAAQERGVVGETPNLAARVQGLAEPNSVVIADGTRRQVGGLFDFADLGPKTLAGFAEPQHAWRVLGDSGTENRFEALRSGEIPLVGREEEVALLTRRWDQAENGEGKVVLISGEAGIGKSRLTAALTEHVEASPHARLRYFCSPHHQDSAFHPVIGQLERAAGFARADGPEGKREKLAAMLTASTEEGDISLLVELLSLPGGDRFPPLDLSPPAKKQRTFLALLRQLEGLSRTRPILVIFEDLHWIDPTSREFLDLLMPRIDRLPVLLMATFRPEFQPPWTGQPHVTTITLNRLGRHDGASLVERLTGNVHALPPDVIAEIVERTDGVPLFVEEMTKAVLEVGAAVAGSVPSARLGVPATLQASLMARLDRLGAEAKSVAQVGAAIGREFSHELAAAAGELAEGPLRDALRRLVDAGLVFQRGEPPNAEYLFKHALVQDATYGSLLRRTRQQLHARIAAALEARFPDRAAREPEALARHFSEAQQFDRAVGYWLTAGGRALQRSANREAISHLSAGLGQVEQLSDAAERTKQELALQRLLGQAYFHVKGLGAIETDRAFNRARELCAVTGDDLSILPVLQGILIVEWGAGQLVKSEKPPTRYFCGRGAPGYRSLHRRGLRCRRHSHAIRQAISGMEFLRQRDRILSANRRGHRVARRLRL
jgi:class 3 adenylate cyclase